MKIVATLTVGIVLDAFMAIVLTTVAATKLSCGRAYFIVNKVPLIVADLSMYVLIVASAVVAGLKEGVWLAGFALSAAVIALSTFSIASVLKLWLAGRSKEFVVDNGIFTSTLAVIISVFMAPFFVSIYSVLIIVVAMYAFVHSTVTLCYTSRETRRWLLNPLRFHRGCVGLNAPYEHYLKMREEGRV